MDDSDNGREWLYERAETMAEINYSALQGHIAMGKPSPVYLICGDEGYLRRRSLEMLKEKYMPSSTARYARSMRFQPRTKLCQ